MLQGSKISGLRQHHIEPASNGPFHGVSCKKKQAGD